MLLRLRSEDGTAVHPGRLGKCLEYALRITRMKRCSDLCSAHQCLITEYVPHTQHTEHSVSQLDRTSQQHTDTLGWPLTAAAGAP